MSSEYVSELAAASAAPSGDVRAVARPADGGGEDDDGAAERQHERQHDAAVERQPQDQRRERRDEHGSHVAEDLADGDSGVAAAPEKNSTQFSARSAPLSASPASFRRGDASQRREVAR